MEPTSRGTPRDRWLVAAATTVAIVPLLVALVRAQRNGWYPAGDNAYFSLRARDVLTADHPLLGTWTSASLTADTQVNNPGPLLFDLLAIPAKLDHRIGVAAGAVLVNALAIVGMVLAGWWTGGRRVALLAAAMGGALAWTLGSGMVVEPWQPHSLLLPALTLLVLVWGLVGGRSVLWPWAIGVGSLLVQTHISYAYLVTGLLAVALVASWRHGIVRRHLAIAALVGLVLWAQPVADQIGGRGNLLELPAAAGSAPATTGWGFGARLTATVLASPGAWGHPDFADAFVPEPLQEPGLAGPDVTLQEVPSPAGAAVGLALITGLLAAAGLLARRAEDRVAVHGVVTAAIAAVLAYATAANIPIGQLGLGPHQLRFLWPVAIFVTGVAALGLLGRMRGWTAGVLVAVVVLSVANLPDHAAEIGPGSERTAMQVLDELVPQLDDLDRDATYFVGTERSRLFDPYTTPLMLELQARGIDFTVSYPYTVPQVGERRRDDGEADAGLIVVEGPAALEPPEDRRLVAIVRGLDDRERRELERLTADVRADLERTGLPLSDTGEQALGFGLLPALEGAPAGEIPVDALVDGGDLAKMVLRGYVDPPSEQAQRWTRWATLRNRWHDGTVGVWLGPPPAAEEP